MSVAYSQQPNRPGMQNPQRPAGNPPSPAQVQKILDENCGLIQTIQDFQNMGKAHECMAYHQQLHRNLVYLATLADSTQNIPQMLPVCHYSIFPKNFNLINKNFCSATTHLAATNPRCSWCSSSFRNASYWSTANSNYAPAYRTNARCSTNDASIQRWSSTDAISAATTTTSWPTAAKFCSNWCQSQR